MKLAYLIFFCLAIGVFSSCCNGEQCDLCLERSIEAAAAAEIVEVDPRDYIQLDSCNGLDYDYDEFEIKFLAYDSLPYVEHDESYDLRLNYDDAGVPMNSYEGRLNYHPVTIAEYGLQLLDVYHDTKDELLFEDIVSLAEKLEDLSYNVGNAMFFPYTYDFSLHGIAEETMKSPWFSAMAQGVVLSFYCRLYEKTNEQSYLDISNKIFESFIHLKGNNSNPWVSCVDKNKNLWLEVYPKDVPTMVLNGMNSAIYGIYDYYRITKKKKAKTVLMAALTTIKVHASDFRRENEMSVYCLKHNIQSEFHHELHSVQLHYFYLMTGDEYFEEMSLLLREDYTIVAEE